MAQPHRLAIITAGAAGMYCGSCLHDNAIARELHRSGHDVRLIPTYTPIRTDETDVSIDQVFFGGINVYLDQKVPLFRRVPTALVGWLDHPAILRWATSRGVETDASLLGPMCVSMLRGAQGRMRREVLKLVRYLEHDFRPQLINFSNVLIAGSAELIKQRLSVPLVVTLQGDDIFLDGLPSDYRKRAFDEIGKIDKHIDAYLTHSHFYANKMAEMLNISRTKMHAIPLGVTIEDLEQPQESAATTTSSKPCVGYLARLAPEKGLHVICEAIGELHKRGHDQVRLAVAGWLGNENKEYAEQSFQTLRKIAGDVVEYHGAVDRSEKRAFLNKLDLMCVPSPYEEPKGLYVLEALAAGVPALSPNHGAFPELAQELGGVALFDPHDPTSLVDTLESLLTSQDERHALSLRGSKSVRKSRSTAAAATAAWQVFQEFL